LKWGRPRDAVKVGKAFAESGWLYVSAGPLG
jgi:hypothetical protein